MPIAILSDEGLDTILGLLRREAATLNDDGGICERLVRLLRRAPDHVYMIVDEATCWGAWTNPRDAARWYLGYRKEPDPDLDAESMIQCEMVDEMADTLNCPMLVEMPIDPAGRPWSVGLEGNMLIASRRTTG